MDQDDLGVDPSMEVLNLDDPEVCRKLIEERKLKPVARLEVLSVTFDKNEFEPIDTNPYDSDGMIMPEGYKEEDTDTDTDDNPIKDRDSHADIDGDCTYDTNNDNCIKDCDRHVDIGGGDDTYHNRIKDRDSHMDIGGDDTGNNLIKGRDNNNVDIGEDDTDSTPYFRVYITDGAHVQEIYDPAKVDKLLCTLPPLPLFGNQNIPKRARGDYSISGHQADLPLIGQNEEQEHQDSGRCGSPLLPKLDDSISGRNTGLSLSSNLCEEEMQLSGSSQLGLKRKLSHVISRPTVLPLTGPNGDIVPTKYFDVIVRKDSKHIDESHRDWINVNNSCIIPSDVVTSWQAIDLSDFNERFELKVYCPFGAVTLDCIVFNTSRLVTVALKWLAEGSGENGKKKKHATETTYICGKVEFYNGEFEDMKSVLLETPEDKAVMVKGDGSVPLLRSVVAVPECSSFTVHVNLQDAITDSGIDSLVAFQVNFSERGIFKESKEVSFAGAKIVVEVTMNTNDNIDYLLFGDRNE